MAGFKVDNLAQQIAQGLSEYNEEVTKQIKAAVDEVSAQAATELKSTSPQRTGAYAKDWTSKKAYEDSRSKRSTVYNKSHYQLTHLLEFGHAKRGGGRVAAVPHIKQVEDEAIKRFEEKIEGAIG